MLLQGIIESGVCLLLSMPPQCRQRTLRVQRRQKKLSITEPLLYRSTSEAREPLLLCFRVLAPTYPPFRGIGGYWRTYGPGVPTCVTNI